MTTFQRLRKIAVRGILERSHEASLQLYHQRCDAHSNDTIFVEFRFTLNQDVSEHLRTAQAVAEIAELMTIATRNDWRFRPQLIADGQFNLCYRLPVPAKHAAILHQFTTPNPRHWS